MSVTWLIWLGIVSGSGAGLLAGLIGIGGGIVVVPVVYFGLLTSGIPQDEAVHVAVATSLAAILLAAIVSFLTHRRAGKYGLRLPEGRVSGYRGGRCHGAVRGSARAGQCNDCNLCRALSGFRGPVCFSQTLSPLSGPATGAFRHVAGVGIGLSSGFAGIGSGILTNIVMTLSGLPMHKSIGRAAAAGVVVSVPATIAAALASKANHALEIGSVDITM